MSIIACINKPNTAFGISFFFFTNNLMNEYEGVVRKSLDLIIKIEPSRELGPLAETEK